MQQTPVNPWYWSDALGYHQALLVTGASRQLFCAGQTAVDATGAPQHQGDMQGQITLAFDNVEAVLHAAGMGVANITRLVICSTDIDETLRHFGSLVGRLQGAAPPMTLLGVTRLAIPSLLIEIEVTAAD